MPLLQATTLLRSIAARAWAPRPQLDVAQWAEQYRFVSAKAGAAEPGAWRNARTPYLVQPMRDYTDPTVQEIVLIFASQTGKTESIMNMIGYTFDILQDSMILQFPVEDDCQIFSQERLRPTIEDTPRLRALVRKDADITNRSARINGCVLNYAWARSARTQKSKPRAFVFCDEIDEYEDPDAVDRIRERGKTFAERKLVCSSTPSDENVGIHARYLASDRRTYRVPCPHCQTYQKLVWGQVRWEGGAHAAPDEVLAHTWYECAECHERIEEREKQGMLARGIWCPEEAKVTVGADGVPEITDQRGQPWTKEASVRGYQLSGLYSPFPSSTWGHIAAEFVRAGGSPGPEWYRGQLAEPYVAKGRRLEIGQVELLRVPTAQGGYLKRTIPDKCLVLIAGVDVQMDRLYFVVRGFGLYGGQSWLIDHGMRMAPEGNGLSELRNLIESWHVVQRVQVMNQSGRAVTEERLWAPVVWACDSGHRAKQVYDLARSFMQGVPKLVPVKGRDGQQLDKEFDWGYIDEKNAEVKISTMPLKLLHVQNTHWKHHLHQLIMSHPELRGSEDPGPAEAKTKAKVEGAADGQAQSKMSEALLTRFHLPADVEDEYLKQLTSEEFRNVSKRGRISGGRWEWVLRPGQKDNHYKDCEKYIFACAEALGIRVHDKISRGRVIRPPGGGGGGSGVGRDVAEGAVKPGPSGPRPNRPVTTWGGRQLGRMM